MNSNNFYLTYDNLSEAWKKIESAKCIIADYDDAFSAELFELQKKLSIIKDRIVEKYYVEEEIAE